MKSCTHAGNEGFRGHPSIGAAVLARKYALPDENSVQWTEFIDKVRQDMGSGGDVKIFLAGSVFGGTGAAGIPTVARLLRNDLDKYEKRVSLGCGLILPYFNFTVPEDETALFARSENFLTNTKAALKYYSQKENVFNLMYFVGDSLITPVKEFSPGATTQKNDAHIVDFYSAMLGIQINIVIIVLFVIFFTVISYWLMSIFITPKPFKYTPVGAQLFSRWL